MKHEIKICMGSSCFARGNDQNLDFIEQYISTNNLEAEVELIGARCENKCAAGPNIIIDGTIYNEMDIEKIQQIMDGLVR